MASTAQNMLSGDPKRVALAEYTIALILLKSQAKDPHMIEDDKLLHKYQGLPQGQVPDIVHAARHP
jgi:hypothetical protein